MMKDYYLVLGVQPNATADEIKAAYRDKLQFYHPDRWQDSHQMRQKAEEYTKEINEAYAVLNNPIKRAEYDNSTRSSRTDQWQEHNKQKESQATQSRAEDERRKREEAARYAKEEQLRKERADREREEAEKRRQEQAEVEKRRADYERVLIGKLVGRWQRTRIEEREGKGFVIRFLLGKIFGVNALTFKEDKTFIGKYPFPSRMLYPGTYRFIDQTHILMIPSLEEKEIEMELVNDELNVNRHYFRKIR